MGNISILAGVSHPQVDLLPPVAKSASPLPSLQFGLTPELATFSQVALPPEPYSSNSPARGCISASSINASTRRAMMSGIFGVGAQHPEHLGMMNKIHHPVPLQLIPILPDGLNWTMRK